MEENSNSQARSTIQNATAAQSRVDQASGLRTPQARRSKRLKRVRFSDPGPRISNVDGPSDISASTGLTPAVSRTRLGPAHSTRNGVQKKRAPTPGRRRSAPVQRLGSPDLRYESTPGSPARDSRAFQFLPFHDVLDTRTMRRIARSGFSEEINKIEQEKRKRQRTERAKAEELTKLRNELEMLRGVKMEIEEEDNVAPSTPERARELMKARQKVQELERLLRQHEGQSSPIVDLGHASPCPTTPRDEDMLSLAEDVTMDDTVAFSSSPAPSRINTLTPATSVASMQVDFESSDRDDKLRSANEELERLRREKCGLFKEWRALVQPGSPCPPTADAVVEDAEEPMSPPPDFTEQIIATLRASTARESDAVATVDNLYKELSSHGFEGSNADEVLANIGARLRQARIDLERAVPGETADADLTNWKQIIDVLVARINFLVKHAAASQEELSNRITQEKTLRGQFNASLLRLEKIEKRNANLEQDADGMAEDMLHARMKMQALENDIKNLETDKGRLSKAIENYRTDLKVLETLNMKLEDEVLQYREEASNLKDARCGLETEVQGYRARVDDLEQSLLGTQRKFDEIQSLLDQRNVSIAHLETEIANITTEKESAIADLNAKAAEKSQLHEEEVGVLNVRLSSLATSLHEAKSEVESLRRDKCQVELKLQAFLKLFSKETIKAAHERVNQTADALVAWERGMSMFDDPKEGNDNGDGGEAIQNSGSGSVGSFAAIGSEPITPACESRFKNVELDRGKKRKRRHPDSGIGMIEEEE